MTKPNLASGIQGVVAPPEEPSGGLIADSRINISGNLTEMNQNLATSNAMIGLLVR